MSGQLLWIVTALYAIQAGICLGMGQNAQFLMLIGYVVANVGLIWSVS